MSESSQSFKDKYCGPSPETEPTGKQPHFPRSVCEAHWIDSPREHESHPGQSLVTRSHDVILDWAQQRNAIPATVPGTEHGNELGVLRFDVPNWGSKRALEHVTWDQWFQTFDDRQLVMIFQEHMENGRQSNFFHFNSPFREHM
jgi:hypothetical protein